MSDIFISYRRKNGEAWASLIKQLLEKREVRCYLDKHKKRTKDFKEALFRNIDQANNFLIILSEGVLDRRDEEIDWVREEIIYAKKHNKNIIAMMFSGFDMSKVDFAGEPDEIKFLKTFECLKFEDANVNLRNASIDTIIQYMVDENNKPWKKTFIDNNNWYSGDEISDEDRLWMITSNEVCRRLDLYGLEQILKNSIFEGRSEINFFYFLVYDISSLIKKIEVDMRKKFPDLTINTYGFCHSYELKEANDAFGENHFMLFKNEKEFDKDLKELLKINKIPSIDIVDFSLVLKDCKYPERVLRKMVNFLNPNGSAIYIRDLDDDLVVAYPDEKRLVKKMVELLSLDPGAGNRHFGQRIYTYLNKSGAEEVHMVDGVVSTANFKIQMQRKICDAYFSYLVPEFRQLVKDKPDNEEYVDALNWLDQYYPEAESLFESREFYFRAGFIAGYAIYKDDDFYED